VACQHQQHKGSSVLDPLCYLANARLAALR